MQGWDSPLDATSSEMVGVHVGFIVWYISMGVLCIGQYSMVAPCASGALKREVFGTTFPSYMHMHQHPLDV